MMYQHQIPPPPSYFHSQISVVPPPHTLHQTVVHTYPQVTVTQPQPQQQLQVPIILPSQQQHAVPIVVQQPFLRSRDICCATARTLSNLIAWIQMVSCGVAFVVAIVMLARLGQTKEYVKSSKYRSLHYSDPNSVLYRYGRNSYSAGFDSDTNMDLHIESMGRKFYSMVVTFSVVLLIMSAVGFATGLILQQGVSQKKPTYLTVWIIFTVFNVLLSIGSAIAISTMAQTFNEDSSFFMGHIGSSIFCIWVVMKHRAELEEFSNSYITSQTAFSHS